MRIQNNWGHHIVDDKEEEDDDYGNICMTQSGNFYTEGIYKNFFKKILFIHERETHTHTEAET